MGKTIKLDRVTQIFIVLIILLIGFLFFYHFVIFLPNQPKQQTQYQPCIEEAYKNQHELYQRLCNKYGKYREGKCFLPEEMAQNLHGGVVKQIKNCIELYK